VKQVLVVAKLVGLVIAAATTTGILHILPAQLSQPVLLVMAFVLLGLCSRLIILTDRHLYSYQWKLDLVSTVGIISLLSPIVQAQQVAFSFGLSLSGLSELSELTELTGLAGPLSGTTVFLTYFGLLANTLYSIAIHILQSGIADLDYDLQVRERTTRAVFSISPGWELYHSLSSAVGTLVLAHYSVILSLEILRFLITKLLRPLLRLSTTALTVALISVSLPSLQYGISLDLLFNPHVQLILAGYTIIFSLHLLIVLICWLDSKLAKFKKWIRRSLGLAVYHSVSPFTF
jgi:hypothetical protein